MTLIFPYDLSVITVLNIYCNIEVTLDNFKTIHRDLYTSEDYLKVWYLGINKDLLIETIEKQIDNCHQALTTYDLKKP